VCCSACVAACETHGSVLQHEVQIVKFGRERLRTCVFGEVVRTTLSLPSPSGMHIHYNVIQKTKKYLLPGGVEGFEDDVRRCGMAGTDRLAQRVEQR